MSILDIIRIQQALYPYMLLISVISDYMPEEVLTVVRIPIAEIESSLRAKHTLPRILSDVHIDGDSLVLHFSGELESPAVVGSCIPSEGIRRRRREHRKRNRMKTRGWEIVARMTNSKGQKCAIYKPFVEALRNLELSTDDQRKIVEKLLRSNRNKPTETSTQYFLENTLEYLQNQDQAEKISSKEGLNQ
jgi:hypothetical protein